MDEMSDWDFYGDADPNNVRDGGRQNARAGDDLPGYPLDGHSGWRSGVFGSGRGDARNRLARRPGRLRETDRLFRGGRRSRRQDDRRWSRSLSKAADANRDPKHPPKTSAGVRRGSS
jgi:hypothetical protein